MIIIGILGSRGKSDVGEVLDERLRGQGKEGIVIGTNQERESEFLKLLYNNIDYAIIEISREDILENSLDKIKFDILIQTALEKESSELIKEIQKFIGNIKQNGYIIFNSDSIQKINFKCDGIYPITYGLNGKTTVTASSIDDIDGLYFSYCLQRSIFTVSNTVVQPFEKPVKVEGKSDDVYYYLAALTCFVIMGFKL